MLFVERMSVIAFSFFLVYASRRTRHVVLDNCVRCFLEDLCFERSRFSVPNILLVAPVLFPCVYGQMPEKGSLEQTC